MFPSLNQTAKLGVDQVKNSETLFGIIQMFAVGGSYCLSVCLSSDSSTKKIITFVTNGHWNCLSTSEGSVFKCLVY